MEIADRIQEFEKNGYTIFKKLYDDETMLGWRTEQDRLQNSHQGIHRQPNPWWFGNMLERSPTLMWPAVNNETIIDFAERLVGPFIQLDNLTLAAFPPRSSENVGESVSGWHRDRWSHMPLGHYERPLSMNAICYLQDLTEESGVLRVIPGSHIEPITLDPDAAKRPHQAEHLVHMEAGDVVLTHNGLLHSGTPNTSQVKRYFMSVYYNLVWLKHTDTFDGPNIRQIKNWAREKGDRRALRLLGEDDQLERRVNSGFLVPDQARWATWLEEDADVLRTAANSSD